jgi:hypothetical protein
MGFLLEQAQRGGFELSVFLAIIVREFEARTLGACTQCFEHVCGLTCRTFGLLKHVEDKTQFTQETKISDTGSRGMLKRHVP